MPRRNDLKRILIVGSGPIVIGQACEFDYSGTQACKALREDGYEVVLINSNPATIMTDPETADRTYVEPITWQYVQKSKPKNGAHRPKSRIVPSIDEARDAVREIGLPMIIRASFTLGGTGGGIAYNREEFESKV